MGQTLSAQFTSDLVESDDQDKSYRALQSIKDKDRYECQILSGSLECDDPDEEYVLINNKCPSPLRPSLRSKSLDTKNYLKLANHRKFSLLTIDIKTKANTETRYNNDTDSFVTACHNSLVTVIGHNIVVLGQTGAGKTSTICHLLGNGLPESPSSTDLIEILPKIYWQSNRSQKLRIVTEENKIHNVSQPIIEKMQQKSTRANIVSWNTSSLNDSVISPFLDAIRKEVYKELVKIDLPPEDANYKPTEQHMILYQIIDCGGMPFFRHLLPQFFPGSNTIYLVVHNLSDRLHQSAQIRVLKNGRLVHHETIPTSNLEEISSWINIARSCSSSELMSTSMNTLMVGTHYDQLKMSCFNNDGLAKEAALMATNSICEHVCTSPTESVLDPDPAFVSNDLAGTNKCQGILRLRKKLKEFSSNASVITMPVLWVALINHIKMVAEERTQPVVPLTEFYQVASMHDLSQDEALKALKKFNELCLVFYVSSASYLSQYIFTDIQWLFASLANVLNCSSLHHKQGKYYANWIQFTECGFMNTFFHSHIFSQVPQSETSQVQCLPHTWLSDMLQHLHLMAPTTKDEETGYFCPILLPSTPIDDNESDPFRCDDSVEPVYLIPTNATLPPGFLARVIVVLSRQFQLCYCTSQISATFSFTSNGESYLLRIIEDKGGIKIEFCNLFPILLDDVKACDTSRYLINVIIKAVKTIETVWTHTPSLEYVIETDTSTRHIPCLYLDCSDPDCKTQHLTKVCPLPLNNVRPYVQCCLTQRLQFFADLPTHQMIWIIHLVKDESEKATMNQKIIAWQRQFVQFSTPTTGTANTYPKASSLRGQLTISADGLTCHRQSVFGSIQPVRNNLKQRQRHLRARSSPIPARKIVPCIDTKKQAAVPHILDRHFELLYDHLDLYLCNRLYQYGILTENNRSKIYHLAGDSTDIFRDRPASEILSAPNHRTMGLRLLVDGLKEAGDHGFMGFISALEETADSTNKLCGHRIILEALERDQEFIKIKKRWLRSLTVE